MNAFLLAYKPAGLGSTRLISIIKKRFNIKKVGHTGTLDRFAEGLMLVLLGRATSLADFFLHCSKQYEALFYLGAATDTHDSYGEISEQISDSQARHQMQSQRPQIEQAITSLIEQKSQIPPLYSALKKKGQRFSDRARQGSQELPASRPITVYQSRILDYQPENQSIKIQFKVSGGTYIRAFARDLGHSLGIPMHLRGLKRTALAHFSLAQDLVWHPDLNPDADQFGIKADRKFLQNQLNLLRPDWPLIPLQTAAEQTKLLHGQKVSLQWPDTDANRTDFFICDPESSDILAWANQDQDSWKYKRIFIMS